MTQSTDVTEILMTRLAILEKKYDQLERNIPKICMGVLQMFFKAAAEARNNPGEFEFELFDVTTDSLVDSMLITLEEDTLKAFTYGGPDQWVEVDWIMKDSIIWNKAVHFLKTNNMTVAYVKLVMIETLGVKEDSHE